MRVGVNPGQWQQHLNARTRTRGSCALHAAHQLLVAQAQLLQVQLTLLTLLLPQSLSGGWGGVVQLVIQLVL